MSPSSITLLFLLFAVAMFVLEKIPLGVTSMIVCIGLVVTGVLVYHILMDIEDFLKYKIRFIKELDETQLKIYWKR